MLTDEQKKIVKVFAEICIDAQAEAIQKMCQAALNSKVDPATLMTTINFVVEKALEDFNKAGDNVDKAVKAVFGRSLLHKDEPETDNFNQT